MAAGVLHAVLLRALPAIRHDLAGPLSVMRMGMAVLKRRFAPGGGIEPAQALERVEQLEAQLGTLGAQVRRLRHWDLHDPASQPARATLQEAIGLAHPLLALHGVALQPLADGGATDEGAAMAHGPLLYVSLAAIYHLAEAADGPPAEVALHVDPSAVRIQALGRAATDAPPLAGAQPTPPIDADALRCLARHLGITVRVDEQSVEIDLAPASHS